MTKNTPYLLALAVATLAGCAPAPKLVKTETQSIHFKTTENNTEKKEEVDYIAPYKKLIDAEMNAVLGTADIAHVKDLPESTLGNLTCDLVQEQASIIYLAKYGRKIDIVMLNNGGLRASLPKGAITRGKLFELMPFENDIAVLTLSGEKTKELFDYVARNHGMPMAGIKLGIQDTIAKTILINKVPFDETKTYTIATSDYLAAGGDKMKFFNKPLEYHLIGLKLRDAIIQGVEAKTKEGKTLNYPKDGRIFYEKKL
ncbi:MAG: 5'-nucleotidase [Bacteroidia bacterium]|jgi:2',3'-cyclic-nucleotide 2'-phosphodiesterase (5'-nucleotidase family)